MLPFLVLTTKVSELFNRDEILKLTFCLYSFLLKPIGFLQKSPMPFFNTVLHEIKILKEINKV